MKIFESAVVIFGAIAGIILVSSGIVLLTFFFIKLISPVVMFLFFLSPGIIGGILSLAFVLACVSLIAALILGVQNDDL